MWQSTSDNAALLKSALRHWPAPVMSTSGSSAGSDEEWVRDDPVQMPWEVAKVQAFVDYEQPWKVQFLNGGPMNRHQMHGGAAVPPSDGGVARHIALEHALYHDVAAEESLRPAVVPLRTTQRHCSSDRAATLIAARPLAVLRPPPGLEDVVGAPLGSTFFGLAPSQWGGTGAVVPPPPQPLVVATPPLPSLGSCGPHQTCAASCKFHCKGRCKDGAQCTWCHVCPWTRSGERRRQKAVAQGHFRAVS